MHSRSYNRDSSLNWPVNPLVFGGLSYIRGHTFVRRTQACGMPRDLQAVFMILVVQSLYVRPRVRAVIAFERPEVYYHHFAAKSLHGQRVGVYPPLEFRLAPVRDPCRAGSGGGRGKWSPACWQWPGQRLQPLLRVLKSEVQAWQ